MSRPPDSRSRVESSLAARSGWRWASTRTWESSRTPVVIPASHPSVAVVSYQTVDMAPASRSGMAVWSQTPT